MRAQGEGMAELRHGLVPIPLRDLRIPQQDSKGSDVGMRFDHPLHLFHGLGISFVRVQKVGVVKAQVPVIGAGRNGLSVGAVDVCKCFSIQTADEL